MAENVVAGRRMTFGEKAVGLTFNPSSDPRVDDIKRKFADVIDFCNDQCSVDGAKGERIRMLKTAITNAQTAQMWAVKALTWKD